MTKKPALVYVRVSTTQQAQDGVGLQAQEAKCRAHVERLGAEVLEVFKDEGISGKDGVNNRPGLKALIARSKEIPDAVVVVYSVSRLARRQRLLWQLLDEKDGEGLSISSATESFDNTTPTGRAMLGMLGVFAQLEADMCSERTKDALAEVKASGKKLGRKSMKELCPETVEHVKKLYATGLYSQRALADELNRQNYPTVTGQGKWALRSVQIALNS